MRIKFGNPNYQIDLSEAFLQFCGGGSCGGWGLTSGLAFAQSTGTTDEACMPYQPTNMNCSTSRCSDWANRLTKISSFTGYATMGARKDAIAASGPLLAGMAVYNDFFAYTTGVYVKTAGSALALRLPLHHRGRLRRHAAGSGSSRTVGVPTGAMAGLPSSGMARRTC